MVTTDGRTDGRADGQNDMQKTDKQASRQVDRQTCRQTCMQTGRHADRQTGRHVACGQTNIQANRHAYRPAGKRTGIQADKQTNEENMTRAAMMMTAMTMPSLPSPRSSSDYYLFCHPHPPRACHHPNTISRSDPLRAASPL